MSYYAVVREAGPGWSDGKGTFEQEGVNDHAAFMNDLCDQGFVLFAGPLAGSEQGRIRALVIFNANGEADIHERLADDPWVHSNRLVVRSVEPWNLFIGAGRMASAQSGAADPRS